MQVVEGKKLDALLSELVDRISHDLALADDNPLDSGLLGCPAHFQIGLVVSEGGHEDIGVKGPGCF